MITFKYGNETYQAKHSDYPELYTPCQSRHCGCGGLHETRRFLCMIYDSRNKFVTQGGSTVGALSAFTDAKANLRRVVK